MHVSVAATKSPRSKRSISPTSTASSVLPSPSKGTQGLVSVLPPGYLSLEGGQDSHTTAGNGTAGAGAGSGSVSKRKRRQSFDITQFLPDMDGTPSSGARVASALLSSYGSTDNMGSSQPQLSPNHTAEEGGEGEGVGGVGGNEEDQGVGAAATAATHSVVSFCMQRNPWRYTNETPTHVPLHIEQQPGEREEQDCLLSLPT